MTDLISRADADAAIVACKGNGATRQACRDAIAALPAVTVGVPCTWPSCRHTARGQCNPSANLAALEPVAAPKTVVTELPPVRYCPICDIADCATHRPVAAPDPAAITADEFDKRNRGYMPAKGAAE